MNLFLVEELYYVYFKQLEKGLNVCLCIFGGFDICGKTGDKTTMWNWWEDKIFHSNVNNTVLELKTLKMR